MESIKVAVVSAGLSQAAATRLLAGRLAEATELAVAEAGQSVDIQVIELRDLATEIANNFVTGFPSAELRKAIETVTDADGIIAVTPIFSASYSGLFKSFFDVIDDTALVGKPVLIAATGGTARHSLALEHAIRPLFAYLRTVTVPTAVFAAAEDWGDSGDSYTTGLPERISRAAGELAGFLVGGGSTQRAAEGEVTPFAEQLAALRRP